ncbi:MAG: Ig-like domain-containing protein [bacterium]
MPVKSLLKIRTSRRWLAWLTAAVLVLQNLVWGGFLSPISPAHADDEANHIWTFGTPGDYSTEGAVTIGDGFAIANMQVTAATDSMDSRYGGVTDLLETTVPGTILAAVSSGAKYPLISTDFGNSWTTVEGDNGLLVGTATKLTRVTTGESAGRIVAVGNNGAGAGNTLYSNDKGASWTGSTNYATVSSFTAVEDISTVASTVYMGAGAGENDDDGTVWKSTDSGATFAKTLTQPPGVVAINDILEISLVGDGTRIFVAATDVNLASELALFYSDDGGDTWTAATPTWGSGGGLVSAVNSLLTTGSGVIYATMVGGHRLIKSSDYGVTWSVIPVTGAGGAKALASAGTEVIAVNNLTGESVNSQIFRSIDGGTDFVEQDNSDEELPETISAVGVMIRMSNYQLLLGVTTSLSLGNAYRGTFGEMPPVADTLTNYLTNETGPEFASARGFSVAYADTSEASSIGFQISNDGTNWYYYKEGGEGWTLTEGGPPAVESSSASDINANIASFDDEVGSGTFYFRVVFDNVLAGDNAPVESNINTINIDSVTLTYTAPTITVTAPNGAEVWNVGTAHDITWTSAGLGGGDIIDILYNTSSGDGDWTSIVNDTANDGAYGWTVPNDPSEAVRVKIKTTDTIGDTSDADFTIKTPPIGGGDNTPPTSTVDALPEYILTPQFSVNIAASDENGVKEVYLYYSGEDENNSVLLWGADDSAPFQWEFDTTAPSAWGDGQYRFYSCAKDFALNDSCPNKHLPPSDGGPLPTIEASTLVDTIAPRLISTTPYYGEEGVGTEADIALEFSEQLDIGSFAYQFYATDTDEPVPDTYAEWNMMKKKMVISHPPLDYETWYTFRVVTARDIAGNNIQENGLGDYDPPVMLKWEFKTAQKMDPDLTNSTIEVAPGPNPDGSYSPGDTANYTVTLINISDLPATFATAQLRFSDGLTYVNYSARASSGVLFTQETRGRVLEWQWQGTVTKGSPVTITYAVTINSPTRYLRISQSLMISDGVHEAFEPTPTVLVIGRDPDFSTSTKIVNKIKAPAGDLLKYIVTVQNTGSTPAVAWVNDWVGNYLTMVNGTLIGTGWERLEYDPYSRRITGETTILPSDPELHNFEFWAQIQADAPNGVSMTNAATIQDPDASNSLTIVQAETIVDNKLELPLGISYLSPPPNSLGVPLYSNIQIGFNKPINPRTFTFLIKFAGYDYHLNSEKWTKEWSDDDRKITITPPDGFTVGATHIFQVVNAEDMKGNKLTAGVFPMIWEFTTVNPTIRITDPADPLIVIPQLVIQGMTVSLSDGITNQPYAAERDITLSIDPSSSSAKFYSVEEENPLYEIHQINIPQGSQSARFYFIDHQISVPDYTTVTLYEDPSLGFVDYTIYIMTTEPQACNRCMHITSLSMRPSSDVALAGQPTKPLTIAAHTANGGEAALPKYLYLFTQSPTGVFLDGAMQPLPTGVSIQSANGPRVLQYFKSDNPTKSIQLYYRDSRPGSYIVAVADNPGSATSAVRILTENDTGYRNAGAVINVLNALRSSDGGVSILAPELPAVMDSTGRALSEIRLAPLIGKMLPNDAQTFYVAGYDERGREIKNLAFKWYATVPEAGVITSGVSSDSHRASFTANDQVGTFRDAVTVVALYNGKIKYATADVRISDVVEYTGGPASLPVSGWTGLQWIFMSLTLVAAVLLAWVEHYDKTHFPSEADNLSR